MVNFKQIKRLMKEKGFVIYTKPYKLNIVGLRAKNGDPKTFNDKLFVFWKNDSGNWVSRKYKITTDPSINYLKNPGAKAGTAILKEGQYVDSYKLGLHKGQYKALVQRKPVTVYRDYNRDNIYNFNYSTQTGFFGINIHRASSTGQSQYIKDYSAGCQVFADPSEYSEFIDLCQRHKLKYGNVFTYTLIDRWMLDIRRKRIAFVIIFIAMALIVLGYIYRKKILFYFKKISP